MLISEKLVEPIVINSKEITIILKFTYGESEVENPYLIFYDPSTGNVTKSLVAPFHWQFKYFDVINPLYVVSVRDYQPLRMCLVEYKLTYSDLSKIRNFVVRDPIDVNFRPHVYYSYVPLTVIRED